MNIAARIDRLRNEGAFQVLAQVNALREQGRDIVSFCIGEPDFPTPQHICDAGIAAIRQGKTKYVPSGGIPRMKESVARYVSNRHNIEVKPANVTITPGVKPALLAAVLATVERGDDVIFPNPGFPVYRSHIEFVGATAVPLPLREEREFRFDIEELRSRITPRTKMIILNSPHNPTGGILTIEDVEAIATLANEHNFWILTDDIYTGISYGDPVPGILSVPGMLERSFVVDGHSKYYSMTGWRLGYLVCREDLESRMNTLMVNMFSCTAAFTQEAGIVALESSQEPSQAMVDEFRRRRDLVVAGLNAIEGISCLTPRGAFYAYPNVTKACRKLGMDDSSQFQEHLLEKAGVAVLGQDCFGPRADDEDQEYIRLSYATSQDNIREGLRRIREAVEGTPNN
ncbi:MAG: aspartate aminotransferase [Armatimonadetes bacterium CG2_30_59_28]|nr:pyridoxal phosphate-dependent aminotransferase [Armatimonadota bacterium]OIO96261.1 MAG: aspartate aminotransferase [Armatimonadetes bacterium CG2_30_59_28]PIU64665.1 MAG: aspartate aminotransferase [Armatimonadetes bacterium CG07_land_8_20_14_0_80_59_28]PIX40318.1 MAG: aspartate aminotransferase [Armatimonadetes bacterium CG_4_8_14_3_um_filter_58_9]PIY48393.1 MAG: aspartate aminotransferase [Armatimonadetes bacterium CG_4_10_14_3_um_filter_59_10]PJB78548.1 MAG: aspartate aminotransferase [